MVGEFTLRKTFPLKKFVSGVFQVLIYKITQAFNLSFTSNKQVNSCIFLVVEMKKVNWKYIGIWPSSQKEMCNSRLEGKLFFYKTYQMAI